MDDTLHAAELEQIAGGSGSVGECFDTVWPWAIGGAATGSLLPGWLASGAVGFGVGTVGAYLTSPACGDGTNTPATLMRNGVKNMFRRR